MTNKTVFRHKTEKATIFKHPSSKKLYMSFYFNGRRVQKTTGSENLERAIATLEATLENNKFFEEQGIEKTYVEGAKIKDIALEVIRDLEETKEPKGSYKNYIRAAKKIIERIGQVQIEKIDRTKLKIVFEEELSKTVAENRRQVLRRIFEKAEDKKIRFHRPSIPKATYKPTEARRAITFDQFEALLDHYAAKFFHKTEVRGRKYEEVINAKKMYEYIILAYATGARPGELTAIKGEDFELRKSPNGEVQYVLTIKNSKTNKHKEIKRQILVEIVIGRYFFEHYTRKNPKEYVFYNPVKEKIIQPFKINQSDKRSNTSYYKKHGMEFFVPYCLRHAFITRKILSGVNLSVLSQHCGNSIQMISQFYTDVINTISYDAIYEEQKSYIEDELEIIRKTTDGQTLSPIRNNYIDIRSKMSGADEEVKSKLYDRENLFGANFLFDTDPKYQERLDKLGKYYASKQGLYYDEEKEQEREQYWKEMTALLEEEDRIKEREEHKELELYGDRELQLPNFKKKKDNVVNLNDIPDFEDDIPEF